MIKDIVYLNSISIRDFMKMDIHLNKNDFLDDILKNRKVVCAFFHQSKPCMKYEKVTYKLTFADKIFRFLGLKDIPKEGTYIINRFNFFKENIPIDKINVFLAKEENKKYKYVEDSEFPIWYYSGISINYDDGTYSTYYIGRYISDKEIEDLVNKVNSSANK